MNSLKISNCTVHLHIGCGLTKADFGILERFCQEQLSERLGAEFGHLELHGYKWYHYQIFRGYG